MCIGILCSVLAFYLINEISSSPLFSVAFYTVILTSKIYDECRKISPDYNNDRKWVYYLKEILLCCWYMQTYSRLLWQFNMSIVSAPYCTILQVQGTLWFELLGGVKEKSTFHLRVRSIAGRIQCVLSIHWPPKPGWSQLRSYTGC